MVTGGAVGRVEVLECRILEKQNVRSRTPATMPESLTDLPPNILSEILSRLPIKSLFVCSPKENLYKVLRIFATVSDKPSQDGFKMEYWAQVHVVGSSSWRDIEDRPLSEYLSWDKWSVFLNGTVCWLCKYPETSKFVVFFDFHEEKFGEIPPPLDFGLQQQMNKHGMSVGVLGGYLCFSDDTRDFDIWVMKKFGSQDSWTKEFVVDTSIHMDKPLEGPFRPLQILGDGKILMIWADRVLVTYDPKTKGFGYLEFDGVESLGKVVLYTPSFVPLKDALMVDNLTVQNMTSRENQDLIED
ncbi:hypothetical protein DH2020_005449 [Rehmannia glutinosa]|uniref:F-box domain-containing protein n=1 Tax=Rehmannia glutinosa TaxID=99300 RepID=A0ABR0XG62_REHGL